MKLFGKRKRNTINFEDLKFEPLESETHEWKEEVVLNEIVWQKDVATESRALDSTIQYEKLEKEYRALAEYLNDMQLVEQLVQGDDKELLSTAKMILYLRNDRQTFQKEMYRMDDSTYEQMMQQEDEMPTIIHKLSDEELYLSKVKREIDLLEGDKEAWKYEKQDAISNHKININLSIVAMAGSLVVFIALLVLQIYFQINTQIGMLLTGICAAVVALGIFIRYYNNINQAAKSEYSLNKVIDKQNKVKLRFVNAVKGVEYIYTKYGVHSASELLYRWEQYTAEKTTRENYRKAGRDLNIQEEKFIKLLRRYQIQDVEIWLQQIESLLNRDEMRVLRERLVRQYEELKFRIERFSEKM